MKFRKRGVVIEAVRWDDRNVEEIRAFLALDAFASAGYVKGAYVDIGTLEGMMVASVGDWIVKGVKGEFYPVKPDVFEQSYEPVQE